MIDHVHVRQDFQRRLRQIPPQGMGLSVDVYSPDLFELVHQLKEQEVLPGYLEVFKATTTALAAVRRAFPGLPLAYHGEGLWITQPDVQESSFFRQDVGELMAQLNCIQSLWLNHECATKQMAGYSFGTYVPPLYTPLSAKVVAANIQTVQQAMDQQGARPDGVSPLFLLELPPLTYFSAGTISIPHFFRLVTDRVSCGLVLDIGHLWTVYRYTGASRRLSLERFARMFLDEFPLERVVELHVAGLACHESAGKAEMSAEPPAWLDAHAAPIPDVLFALLEQVLAHPNLIGLRAVALEVDTKPIGKIVEEYGMAVQRFEPAIQAAMARGVAGMPPMDQIPSSYSVPEPLDQSDGQQLRCEYMRYAQIISGQAPVTGPEWQDAGDDPSGLTSYRCFYLPYEILHWGGDLAEMFPQTCRILAARDVALAGFVPFWFRGPRPLTVSYDFFLLKIERFVEFVAEVAPDTVSCAEQEADLLRQAYAQANEVEMPVMELRRAG
ncbi:MAG: DUF692 family protein [Nitrospira sp.]|nr:DUF692 family protein [Nitrospira sp.]